MMDEGLFNRYLSMQSGFRLSEEASATSVQMVAPILNQACGDGSL